MKKSNELAFKENRQLILDNLPSTFSQLEARLPQIHFNTIRNHLKQLKEENLIHVAGKIKLHANGPLADCYYPGPKPEAFKPLLFKQPDIIPKPDFLTATFFGLTRNTRCQNYSI
jgi:hypothetical protein